MYPRDSHTEIVSDSLRKALEEGRLRKVALALPRTVERRRRRRRDVSRKALVLVTTIALGLIGMLCYAVWRVRVVEESSETADHDYRMIGLDELDDDLEDNT